MGVFSYNFCYFFLIVCLVFSLRSVYGIFLFLLRVALANESALSFPWIAIWLGIQQNITFLLLFMELSLFRSLTMNRIVKFCIFKRL